MNNKRNTDLEDWFNEKRVSNPIAVTLTLKQKVETDKFRGRFGTPIDSIKISENIRHFMNRLNQQIFKKAFVRFGKRLSVIPVIEGNSRIRYHVHMTLQKPDCLDLPEFHSLISKCWVETQYGYNNIKIKPIYDYEGWISYTLKSKSKVGGIQSSVDLDNVFLH